MLNSLEISAETLTQGIPDGGPISPLIGWVVYGSCADYMQQSFLERQTLDFLLIPSAIFLLIILILFTLPIRTYFSPSSYSGLVSWGPKFPPS